jgi:MGT family glycosyltransferase
MSDIAFLCHPTVGHLNTLLSIGLRMTSEGHSARYFIPGGPDLGFRLRPDILNNVIDVPAAVERQGLPVERLPPALGVIYHAILLSRTHGSAELRRALKLFASGMLGTTKHILRRLERRPADALVVDFFFFPALLAAEKLGIPYVSIYHSGLPFSGPGVPPFGSGLPIGAPEDARWTEARAFEAEQLRLLRGTLEATRRALGLGPGAEDPLRTPSSPWLNLVPSHEAIEAPRTGLGPSCLFVGPCFATRGGKAPEPFPWEKLEEGAFKVYLSLGTVFNNRPEVFRTLLQALAQPGVQTVVSAGASYAELASKPLPGNVLLFRRVPQVDLLPRMDLVIGHGGNNSTNETLAAGKPLLVIPVGGEQHDNARRVEYLGAGLWLSFQGLTVEAARGAVTRLREEARFRERASELQRALARTDGTRTASALIAHLARTKAPIVLPEGAPRTVTADALDALLASLTRAA